MKTFNTTLAGIILLLTPFFLLETSAQAVSYRMICRGGPGMTANVWHYTLSGKLGAEIDIYFKKGTTAGEPKRGECVWLIRAMFEGEPNKLIFARTAPNSQKFNVKYQSIKAGDGPLKYLINRVKRGRTFRIWVERTGSILKITKLIW